MYVTLVYYLIVNGDGPETALSNNLIFRTGVGKPWPIFSARDSGVYPEFGTPALTRVSEDFSILKLGHILPVGCKQLLDHRLCGPPLHHQGIRQHGLEYRLAAPTQSSLDDQ